MATDSTDRGWIVEAKTSNDEDVEAARIAEMVLNRPIVDRLVRRAHLFAVATGKMPEDALLWRWMQEEDRG